jgi:hypothetical protein
LLHLNGQKVLRSKTIQIFGRTIASQIMNYNSQTTSDKNREILQDNRFEIPLQLSYYQVSLEKSSLLSK